MNILITGTSQGIGLELTKQALSLGHRVLAVARNPEASEGLSGLKRSADGLELLKLDVTHREAPQKLVDGLRDFPHLDVLINNAGVYEKDDTPEQFERSFHTNTVAPFFITQALLPKLREAPAPKNINISSQMGSIHDNTSGSSYSYRASKAALNMIVKGLSVDHDWLTSIVAHPGWVQTRMGGDGAPLSIAESVSGLWKLILELEPKHSGSFFDYRGRKLHW